MVKLVSDNRAWGYVALDTAHNLYDWEKRSYADDFFKVQNRLATLGHNLAVAGALQLANESADYWDACSGKPHPRW